MRGPRDRRSVGGELDRIIEFPVDRTRAFDIGAPLARAPAKALAMSGFDRSLDGTQFLVPVPPGAAAALSRLFVIQNWRPEP